MELRAEESKTVTSVESHQITEEPSSAVSDAAVTIGGLTVREVVDEPQPYLESPRDNEASYTAALQLATGVEEVEASESFCTVEEEEDMMGSANDADVGFVPTRTKALTDVAGKGDVPSGLMTSSGTGLIAHYHELANEVSDDDDLESVGTPYTGLDTTRTVGAQSLAFMEGGERYHHHPQARYVPEVCL